MTYREDYGFSASPQPERGEVAITAAVFRGR